MADDDSSLEDCSDIFLRLRFFLSGFDSDTYDQLSVALEQNGGVNMEEFDASCTHVVVSKSVLWDDPICEIARKNGKFLVTEIWVSDCLELGVIADVNHVVYRPLRDSKGIPGSDDLVVCLTGYQNQARTNVMRMVYLMGAKFSKPLVAINVTHLVCYKFEGPKFILAKQIGLKLVNHKWLEDCLKSWSILSEEDYMNSGVEAELLEAEVNDFEDNGSSRVKATSEHRISDIAAGVCESGKQEFVSTNRVAVNGTLNSSGVEAFKLTPARCAEAPVQNLISDPQTVKYEVDTTVAENILIDDESGNFHRGDPARKHPISRTEETLGKICLDHVECTSGDMKTHEKPCGPARCVEAPVQNLISDPQTVKYEVDTTVAENILIDDESGNFHRGDPARKHPISRTEETLGKICLDHAECTSGDMKTHEKPCGESTNSEQIFSTRKSEAVSSPKTNRIKTYSSPVTTNNAHSKENNKSESSPAKVVSVVGVNNSKMASSCSDDLLANEHTHTNEFKISDVNIVKNIDVQATPCCNINLSKEISGHMQIEENYETSSYPSFLHKHEPLNKSNVVANAISVGQSQLKGTKKRKSLTDSSLETVVGYHLECIENTSSRLIDTNIAIPSDIHVVLPGHTNVMTNGVGCVTPVDRSEMKGNRKRKSRETSIVKDLDDTSHTECMISTPFSVAISKSTGHSSGSIKSSSLEKLVSFDVTFPHSTSKTAKINENVLDAVIKDCEKEDENEVHADYKKYNGKKHDRDMLVERAENSTKVSKKQATVSANRLQHAELNSHEREELEKKGKVISNRRKKTPLNDNQDDCIIQKKPVKSSKAVAPKRRDAKNYMAIDATFRDKENVVTSQGRETKSLSKISKTGSVLKDSTKVLTFPSKCMLPNSAKQTCFALSGRKQEIKPFHAIVKRLGGKLCRESHQWSHQTTHLITVGQLRRTEKFFAAAAAGRWILQDDYLKDSADAGVFLDEKKYEWYGSGMTEDGSICLEAPRKWREQRENSGCCALEGLRILLYGECIIPSLDTLKRAIRAGGAELLATSPPYTRFLGSGVHVAIVSPGTPKADFWVQEFLNHNLACVTTDFFVSFVCKPNLSLDQHVLYDSFSAVEKVVAQLKSNERAEKKWIDADACDVEEIRCSVCGSSDREDVMLLCGDDIGNGCGIAMHTDCCKPPLSEVPVNDWFCVQCTKPALLQPKKKTKRKVV